MKMNCANKWIINNIPSIIRITDKYMDLNNYPEKVIKHIKTTWIKINRCDGGTYVEPKFFRESRAPFQEPLFYHEKYYNLKLHPKNCRCGMCVPF